MALQQIVLLLSLVGLVVSQTTVAPTPTPVVLWHGMGDDCCNPKSMGAIKSLIETNIPNVYVRSLEIGSSTSQDKDNGFTMPVNEQIDMVCSKLASDDKMKNGYHSVGFSQGGQFLRAVAQRCPNPPMINFISVGGQHQGVFGIPKCTTGGLCNFMRKLLNMGAYLGYPDIVGVGAQTFSGRPTEICSKKAQYWHDPLNEDEYKKKSLFLAEINNENVKNATYKENLQKLQNFVMIKFLQDTVVNPKESEWFGFYKDDSNSDIQTLNQTALYQEILIQTMGRIHGPRRQGHPAPASLLARRHPKDWLGLQQMQKDGKLKFLTADGDHLKFTDEFFIKEIIEPYLKE